LNLKNKLVSDTRNYFLSKIVPGLMGLLTVMVFVRVVGYEQYGRYAVVFAMVTACATGGAGWIGQGILRFHSQHAGTTEEPSFRGGSQLGVLLSALLGAVAVCAISWPSVNHSSVVLVSTLVLFVPMLVYTVELTRLQAALRSGTVVWVESVRAAGSFLVPIALLAITHTKSYSLLLAGVGIGYLVPVLIGLFVRKARPRLNVSLSIFRDGHLKALRSIWTYGWPVALWLACQQTFIVSDRYFIQKFCGYSQAGVYASIYDVIVRSLSLVFAPITLSVHSVLMHRWNQGDRRRTILALKTAMTYEVLLFTPVPVVLFLCRNWLARLILGRVNPEAAAVLIPLSFAGFLWQLALLAHKPLEMLCRTKRMLIGILLALAVNIVGDFSLIPRFGFAAAAYLSVITACLYLALLALLTPANEFAAATKASRRTTRLPVEEVNA
jgi:O-antigen/teichoic acid export membrane protein